VWMMYVRDSNTIPDVEVEAMVSETILFISSGGITYSPTAENFILLAIVIATLQRKMRAKTKF
jgi:hypothetical protein